MCGRYVVAYDPQTLVSGFSLKRVVPFPKRWNVAPQSQVPVVFETRDGERVAELMRWGLVPHWARDTSIGNKLNNARADGIFDKPSFRQAVRRRRCLLPINGFYEWQALAASTPTTTKAAKATPKQPWYISAASGGLLAMAGLFEAWRADDSQDWLLSCCVITTEPNALMAPIHDRMPVFLTASQWGDWLNRNSDDRETLHAAMVPCPDNWLRAWPVSRVVNSGRSEGQALTEPLVQVFDQTPHATPLEAPCKPAT